MTLDLDFYLRPVTVVAIELLGKVISTQIDGHLTQSIIVETEAYDFPNDKGSHTFNYKKTHKNQSMYLKGGHIYVYKCYGVHNMLNVVTGDENIGTAVLIRAVEPLQGVEVMQKRRNVNFIDHRLTGGPGKVCEALGIRQDHDGWSLMSTNDTIQIEDRNYSYPYICACPRVGMSSKVAECANYPYRYYVKSHYVSRPLNVYYHYGQ